MWRSLASHPQRLDVYCYRSDKAARRYYYLRYYSVYIYCDRIALVIKKEWIFLSLPSINDDNNVTIDCFQ